MKNEKKIVDENIDIEIKLFLEAILLKYGYDFKNYSNAHIKRRLLHRLITANINSISEMQYKILYDKNFFRLTLADLSINVTEMFRDPLFYKAIREKVIPVLKTYPFIKIWHAGCSTGEEVFSMAILLKEEGIYDRTQIYATDFNQIVLKKASDAIYSIDKIKEYTANYQKSGGKRSFSDYYTAKYNSVIFDKSLKENIVFADHNLVSDSIFAEVNLIICRNVLIYFDRILQNKVIKLFEESLITGGFLGLGTKEDIRFTKSADNFSTFDANQKIYRKITV
jgi:chemotaxis protein methyltransferase CheR